MNQQKLYSLAMSSSQTEGMTVDISAAGTSTKTAGGRKRGSSQGNGIKSSSDLHEISQTDAAKRIKINDVIDVLETCVFCGEESCVDSMIQCENCQLFHHLKCCGISAAQQGIARIVMELIGWSCKACRLEKKSHLETLEAELSRVKRQLNESTRAGGVAEQRANSTSSIEAPRGGAADSVPSGGAAGARDAASQITRAQVALIVSKTLSDKARRQKNIIVTGIPETSEVNDERAFTALCEEHLGTKPVISNLGTKRLGKASAVSGRHRRLLVHLETEDAVTDVLRCARKLRTSDDTYISANVFVNPDLTIEEQKLAYERRTKRRSRGASSGAAPDANRSSLNTAPQVRVITSASNDVRVEQNASSDTTRSTQESHHLWPTVFMQQPPIHPPVGPYYSGANGNHISSSMYANSQHTPLMHPASLSTTYPYIIPSPSVSIGQFSNNLLPSVISSIQTGNPTLVPSPYSTANLLDFPPLQPQPFQASSQTGPTYTPSTQHLLHI